MSVPALLDRIYEAAVVPDQWPQVLQQVADHVGSRGCVFLAKAPDGVSWQASLRAQSQVEEYIAQGWARDPSLSAPLLAEQWPGFRSETHYRTPEEIAALPVYRDYFIPRGLGCRLATVVQGAGDAALQISVQGFASHAAAEAAIPAMDALRPHLARALSLTALVRSRSQVVVDSLALAGVAAAVITPDGRLRSANGRFRERMGSRMSEGPGGVRFADAFLAARVLEALAPYRRGQRRVQSVALPGTPGGGVIHLLPIVGAAREVCEADGVLLLLADARNLSVPSADMLRLLFDLTPAEARLARLIAEGRTVPQVAKALGVQANTVRTHLKAVYAKTGLPRQTELALGLVSLGLPGAGGDPGSA